MNICIFLLISDIIQSKRINYFLYKIVLMWISSFPIDFMSKFMVIRNGKETHTAEKEPPPKKQVKADRLKYLFFLLYISIFVTTFIINLIALLFV